MENNANSSGSVFSTNEWLNNHFSIKSRGRYNYVEGLPLQEGHRILELGCANGAWTRLFAERVGPSGLVLGIDHEKELIECAEKSFQYTHLEDRVSFLIGDIDKSLRNIDTHFNVVTLFNVASLLPNIQDVLEEVYKLLKSQTGTLILKDSAIASDFYWPLDVQVAQELQKLSSGGGNINGYDPNFALNSKGVLETCGFKVSETLLNSYAFTYPFSKEQSHYISKNAQMLLQMDNNEVATDKTKIWLKDYMSEDGLFFRQKNSIYTTTEFTYICTPR